MTYKDFYLRIYQYDITLSDEFINIYRKRCKADKKYF